MPSLRQQLMLVLCFCRVIEFNFKAVDMNILFMLFSKVPTVNLELGIYIKSKKKQQNINW